MPAAGFCVSVATMLVAAPAPVFLRQKLIVTVSPGSGAPFAETQLSALSAGAPAGAIRGEHAVQRSLIVVVPAVTLVEAGAWATQEARGLFALTV